MLAFGTTKNGGGGGANYWKLLGNPDNDIGLAAGIGGIEAVLAADPRFALLMIELLGSVGIGFNLSDAVAGITALNGFLTPVPGQHYPGLEYVNNATGHSAEIAVADSTVAALIDIPAGGMGFELKATIFQLADATSTRVFAIEVDGKIRTNQVQSPAQNTSQIIKYIPIYNGSGAMEGFVPVQNTAGIRSGSIVTPVALGPGAGAGATAVLFGNDTVGSISITTGAAPAGMSLVCTVTFNAPYLADAKILISPANVFAAQAQVCANEGGTTFFIDAATPLLPGTTYIWNYYMGQRQ